MSTAEREASARPKQTVLVVGGGVAGSAAALAAARGGATVTLLDGGAGASTLWTGALDLLPWQDGMRTPGAAQAALSTEARAALQALGGYVLDEGETRIATTAGLVRPAVGRDAALMNVASLGGHPIAVVRCPRPGWDADALAAAWGPSFTPLDAIVLRHRGEDVLPDADLASRHDDSARLGWLAERLREALASTGGRWSGVVVPPMLGVERARAQDVSAAIGVRCGEAAGLPGGPPGLRFENARDRALTAYGAAHVRVRVLSVQRSTDVWRAAAEDGSCFDAGAVVLAIGGLIGGGLEYAPAEATLATALPHVARRPMRLTLDAPVTLGAHGKPLEVSRSLFGPPPEAIVLPFARDALLDRGGILARADGAVSSASGIFAAGDVVADAPRAWLSALSSGARAGAAAARHLGFGSVTENARPSLDGEPASRP